MNAGAPLSGTRKAAILMVLVGEDVSAQLLRHLPEDQIASIAREVASLDVIEPELAQRVLEEYFVDATRPEPTRGGMDLARRLLARAEIPEAVRKDALGSSGDVAGELLDPFRRIPPRALARALAEEHPQTSALVLLHLPADSAAQTLARMPDDLRPEMVLRMANLRRVPAEVLGDVASSLHDRLVDPGLAEEEDDDDGLDRTASVLQCLARSETRTLLEALEQRDPERAARLRDKVFTFDSLLLANDRGIQELLRQVDNKKLALALHGCEDRLQDKFLRNLSERAAGMLREEMEYLTAIRPSDQQAARREVLNQALDLERDEKLTFESPASRETAP